MKTQEVDFTILLSTTTSLGKVRGFTVELLFMLSEGGGRCCDLVERSGKPRYIVHKYLERLQKYKLADKIDSFWYLTPQGAEFVKYLKIVNRNILECRQKVDRKKTESRQKVDTSEPKKLKQVSISLWLQNSDPSQIEKEVVEVLVDHYNKTGSKFILFRDMYDLAEKIRGSPEATFTAIRRLRQDNIVYLYRSEIQGYWKLGLKKEFVEARLNETLSDRSYN